MPIFACKDLIGAQKEFILTTCYLSISFDAASEQTGTRKAIFKRATFIEITHWFESSHLHWKVGSIVIH